MLVSPNGKCDEIMRQCPRFERCCVPICPLDADQDARTRLKGEPTCSMSKAVRRRIAAGTSLEREGLTKLEWAAEQKWRGLSESEKKRRLAFLEPFGQFSHGSEAHPRITDGRGPKRGKVV